METPSLYEDPYRSYTLIGVSLDLLTTFHLAMSLFKKINIYGFLFFQNETT